MKKLLFIFSLLLPAMAFAGTVSLNGAGATFPYPLYSKWIAEYNRINPEIQINYQSIGSGGGIRQITERTVDFGASDAPMTDALLSKAPGKLVHIPTTLGAVVVTYNVPEVTKSLRLDPETIAGIFLGEITKWNDPKIVALNKGENFPSQNISVVHRSDGSGTTAVFTDYLSTVSPKWKEKVGSATSVSWPTGLGGKGNEGVAGQVKTTPGSIGYVELAYAKQAKLSYAMLKNHSGKFVEPSLEAISAAAASVSKTMPDDFRVSIVDAKGDKAYPISAFTYLLVYEELSDMVKGTTLARFLWWAIHDGQKFSASLDYSPLPKELVVKIEAKLKTIRVDGKSLLSKM